MIVVVAVDIVVDDGDGDGDDNDVVDEQEDEAFEIAADNVDDD